MRPCAVYRYADTIDANLLRYLSGLPRDKQRRLLSLLQGIEDVVGGPSEEWSKGVGAELSEVAG